MNEMRTKYKIYPEIYIGKTSDFNRRAYEHADRGYPILLRIAEGTPAQISNLETILIERFSKDKSWKMGNSKGGSAGDTHADGLYICLSESTPDDDLSEFDEQELLGENYPIKLKN